MFAAGTMATMRIENTEWGDDLTTLQLTVDAFLL
jgi:hypothetical protein